MHDSLGYLKTLESAGVPVKQAEAHVQMMTNIINSELATRQDVRDLRTEIKSEIKDLRSEMSEMDIRLRADMKNSEDRLMHKLDLLESRMTLKMGSLIVASLTALTALMHFVR